MSVELVQEVAQTLAAHFTRGHVGQRNPNWDPDDEENHPYYLPLTMEQRMEYGPFVHFLGDDGMRSFRAATFTEIAEVVAPLIEIRRKSILREAAAEIRALSTAGEYYHGPGGGWDEDTLDYYGVSNWLEAKADEAVS